MKILLYLQNIIFYNAFLLLLLLKILESFSNTVASAVALVDLRIAAQNEE